MPLGLAGTVQFAWLVGRNHSRIGAPRFPERASGPRRMVPIEAARAAQLPSGPFRRFRDVPSAEWLRGKRTYDDHNRRGFDTPSLSPIHSIGP